MSRISVAQTEQRGKGAVPKAAAEKQFEVRRRKAEWFWLDNDLIDRAGPVIGPIAGAIYTSLARHANNDSQACYPSIKTLAREWGLSHPTVIKAIKTLEKYGLVKVTRHPDAARKHLANLSTLLPPSAWKLPAQVDEPAPDKAKASQPGLPAQNPDGNGGIGGPSKRDLPALVNEVYQPSKRGLPQQDSYNKINNNHHDSAANAASADSAYAHDEGQGQDHDNGRRRYLEELLKAIGDDDPARAVERAMEAGWDLEELIEEVQRVADLNGAGIRSKAGWLRKMLPKGRAAVRAALDRYGAPRRNGNGDGGEVGRLKREYQSLLAELFSAGTTGERRREVEQRGRAVRAELERRGVDVAALEAKVKGELFGNDSREVHTGPELVGEIAYRKRFAAERDINEEEIERRRERARIELPDEEAVAA